MIAAEAELVDLNQRVGELASNLNELLGSLTKLETWIPSVDTGIQALNKAVEGIAARVTVLENSPANRESPGRRILSREGFGFVSLVILGFAVPDGRWGRHPRCRCR